MKAYSESIYEIIIKNSNCDYVTANAEFYAFLGNRLYSTFDAILSESSVKTLENAIAKRSYEKPFVMDILDDKNLPRTMVCVLVKPENPNNSEIHMIEMDRLFDGYFDLIRDEKEKTALLAQSDSVYFTYDRAAGTVTRYRFDSGKNVLASTNLREWRKELAEKLSEDCADKIDKFFSELENGMRSITAAFTDKEGGTVNAAGTAIYSDGIHLKTVGSLGNSNVMPTREIARRDQLTGLMLKEDITNYAKRCINEFKEKMAMAIIDIDDFKQINDNFGHAKGDEVLKRCAAIISEQVEGVGKAGRIGGDEFYIVIDKYEDKDSLRSALRGIKNMIAATYSEEADGFHLTTSIGVSAYPEDTDNFEDLYLLADYMLYRAKSKGKNRYIIYERDKHGMVEDILRTGIQNMGTTGRRSLEKSEIICKTADMVLSDKNYPLEKIMKDIVDYFGVERIILYNKTDESVVLQCGSSPLSQELLRDTMGYIFDRNLEEMYEKGILIVNNTRTFAMKNPRIYEKLCAQGVFSFMQHKIKGYSGKNFLISYEAVSAYITWNAEDMYFFRILDKILERCL